MTRAPEHAVQIADPAVPGLTLSTPVLLAVEALRQAATPPLSDPSAPVRFSDLPALWRVHLQDHLGIYGTLVPPGCERIERADWERLLALLGRQMDQAYRMAGLLALAERGPSREDLAQAPVLAPWSPARSLWGDLVLTGEVTGHPWLGGAWIRTSPLMGLDPQGRWARTWSRWYRLGEPMTEGHLPFFWQSRVRVELIETDDRQVAQHFAALRDEVARLLEPLSTTPTERRT